MISHVNSDLLRILCLTADLSSMVIAERILVKHTKIISAFSFRFWFQPEIIARHGYPIETHEVTTEDGYILNLFRIPYGKEGKPKLQGPPVLLQHGIAENSVIFVYIGNQSLGKQIMLCSTVKVE